MLLIKATSLLAIIALILLLIGVIKKFKILKTIGIIIFVAIIVFWIAFGVWALHKNDMEYKRKVEISNKSNYITKEIAVL